MEFHPRRAEQHPLPKQIGSSFLVARLWKPGYGYKRIGVWETELESEDCVQGHLWVNPVRERKPKLLKLMDQINQDYGPGTLRMASVARDPRWLTKFNHQSPAYTTDPLGIPRAKFG